MRRILIDHARRKKRQKRGGDQSRVDLKEDSLVWQVPLDEALAVHEALDELQKAEPQVAELVKLRYFAGLTVEEAAEALGISERSAYRDWRFARAWLQRRIS